LVDEKEPDPEPTPVEIAGSAFCGHPEELPQAEWLERMASEGETTEGGW